MKFKLPAKKAYQIIIEYIGITFGCALMAVSVNAFTVPNKIAPGGITGLSTVVYHLTNIPVGVAILLFNIPLFLLSLKVLGKSFGIKTLYATIVSSIFIDYVFILPTFTTDLLLAAVFGGVILGMGLGIVFRSGGTTGGTDLIASMINKYFPGFTIGTILMVTDFLVVIIAGLVFRQVEISLYSTISLFISIRILDLVQEGFGYAKAFFIISNYPDEISKVVFENLDRSITSLSGEGMYTREEKQVLLCVVNRTQVNRLKEMIHAVDPNAFVILTEVREVFGEGFKEIQTK